MSTPLARLFTLQHLSLARYVVNASPYVAPGDEAIGQTLASIAAAQEAMSRRISEQIVERRESLPKGTFPLRYTDAHYLNIRSLLPRLVREQHRVLRELEDLVRELEHDPVAHALAIEVLRQETEHHAQLNRFADRVADEPRSELIPASKFETADVKRDRSGRSIDSAIAT